MGHSWFETRYASMRFSHCVHTEIFQNGRVFENDGL